MMPTSTSTALIIHASTWRLMDSSAGSWLGGGAAALVAAGCLDADRGAVGEEAGAVFSNGLAAGQPLDDLDPAVPLDAGLDDPLAGLAVGDHIDHLAGRAQYHALLGYHHRGGFLPVTMAALTVPPESMVPSLSRRTCTSMAREIVDGGLHVLHHAGDDLARLVGRPRRTVWPGRMRPAADLRKRQVGAQYPVGDQLEQRVAHLHVIARRDDLGFDDAIHRRDHLGAGQVAAAAAASGAGGGQLARRASRWARASSAPLREMKPLATRFCWRSAKRSAWATRDSRRVISAASVWPLDLEVGGVELGKTLALLHVVAAVGDHVGDASGHFGADLRVDQCLKRAQGVLGHVQRDAGGLEGGDRGGRRAGRLAGRRRRLVAAAGESEGEQGDGKLNAWSVTSDWRAWGRGSGQRRSPFRRCSRVSPRG